MSEEEPAMAAVVPPEEEDFSIHPFWRVSLALYGRAGVASACLGLQDRRGADVNLLLLVLWLARRGQALDDAALRTVAAVSRDWQAQVVGPVRTARRAAKRAAGRALYERLKAVELECEQAEQRALTAALGLQHETADPPVAQGAARLAEMGLRAYLAGLPGTSADEEEGWLAALVFGAAEEGGPAP